MRRVVFPDGTVKNTDIKLEDSTIITFDDVFLDSDAVVGASDDNSHAVIAVRDDNILGYVKSTEAFASTGYNVSTPRYFPSTFYGYIFTKEPIYNDNVVKTFDLKANVLYTITTKVADIRNFSEVDLDANYLTSFVNETTDFKITPIQDCYLTLVNYTPQMALLPVGEAPCNVNCLDIGFNGDLVFSRGDLDSASFINRF